MKKATLVIDTGGMLIKTVRWPAGVFEYQPWSDNLKPDLDGIDQILLTGGRQSEIDQQLVNYPVEIVPELRALGLGAAHLAELNQCWVVGLGTGTPILQVTRERSLVKHVIGTGVGAGTIIGLGQQLIGDLTLDALDDLAAQGDPARYNMTVGDIYPDPAQLNLPTDLTAGNFAKQSQLLPDGSKADLAAAIFQMIGEVVATVTAAAVGDNKLPVVLSGGGTLYPHLIKVISGILRFYKLEAIIPDHALYATAWGALVIKGLI